MTLQDLSFVGGRPTRHMGRNCVTFSDLSPVLVTQPSEQFGNGSIEIDLCVGRERSFPGVAFRIQGDTYESFFIRPHQVGNPDSIQYTPVFNGVSAWQLYHGPGYWASIDFPIDRWFTMRVAFSGTRGEAYLDELELPALVFGGLKVPVAEGGIGILPGGAGLHVSRLAYDPSNPVLRGHAPRLARATPGTIMKWHVSSAVGEGAALPADPSWTLLECEPTGLANLARVSPIKGRLNTVYVRTTVTATSAMSKALELGFSDRAVIYLNGQALFRGEDTYRSRDYRFLGSIGWYDTIYLPLRAGANDLVIAVSETFGGWGVQARFNDPSGLILE